MPLYTVTHENSPIKLYQNSFRGTHLLIQQWETLIKVEILTFHNEKNHGLFSWLIWYEIAIISYVILIMVDFHRFWNLIYRIIQCQQLFVVFNVRIRSSLLFIQAYYIANYATMTLEILYICFLGFQASIGFHAFPWGMKIISGLLTLASTSSLHSFLSQEHYGYKVMQCRLFISICTYTPLPCNDNVTVTV